MNTEPATVTALPPAVPSRLALDLTLLGAGGAWAVTVALVVVVVAAAPAAVVLYRKGSR